MTTCRIDHSAPGAIPVTLCRTCTPSRNMTADQRAAIQSQERQERDARTIRQALLRARASLDRAEEQAKRGGNPGIEIRKAKSLRAKVAKLEQELEELQG